MAEALKEKQDSLEKWWRENLPRLRTSSDERIRAVAELYEKEGRDEIEEKLLQEGMKAVREMYRALELRAKFAQMTDRERRRKRKMFAHEMIESAKLMVHAGLVDGETGKPKYEIPLLIGGLMHLRELLDNEDRDEWRAIGKEVVGSIPEKAADSEEVPPETQETAENSKWSQWTWKKDKKRTGMF